MYRKFKFKKEFTCPDGTISEGSEIVLIDDRMYFNGGMVNPVFYDEMMEIITNPKIYKEYLVEMIPNKEAYVNNF